ncbi:MAG: hypothetical protein A3F33_00900 [Candidatus Woykebacteria bacterium RIFCSPHIGHO2_12_FULL_43_10]|uniref:N-acetyltransferase domain-containing protein n=2 Tax=Candidatus Woykeibacteriota TaxID=1817899 RepID=A0A1G1WSV8_9BACT|nr:MAG: hypothetical protein A3J50_00370 [Candidatus Woykebacteria bacterium RIFCSPHIGHO2_02_FULL_43_16b]OGY30277.1 MAG: hypothetical protein A3F33_00900 [Candidatus Woykebacteria bacterium RIFCSPHIGHO2_12_FULL_43_10]OGY30819.1 MAG: hypothetical protein A3A61_00145 [Candidatus Woykebacteria bacterium RIFCSPLOWO2_01_FULL_43_14]
MGYQVQNFTRTEMSPVLKWQILTAMRFIWPEGFEGVNLDRTWICPGEFYPLHFIATDFTRDGSSKSAKIVISHGAVLQRDLMHCGETFRVLGLGGVYTLPAFRHSGVASDLVMKATDHILTRPRADVAIATCRPELVGWYSRFGWVPIKEGRIIPTTETENGQPLDEVLLMLFISEKGRRAETLFREEPIYFGRDVW